MTLVSRVRDGLTRSTLSKPDEWLRAALAASNSYSGKSVTVDSSLSLIPVFAAVNRLAFAVGSSPLIVYRRDGERRVRAETTRQWQLLHDKPNEDQASDEFWAMVESHLALWGNAFIWKERAGDGRIGQLWGIAPKRVQVGRRANPKTGKLERVFTLDGRTEEAYTDIDILQIRGLSSDGLVGYSPIQLARNMLGNAMSLDEFQGKFWANGAWPGVVLTHPQKMDSDVLARLKATWKRAHGGTGRAGETAILEDGMGIEQMTMPLEDAQFIEQARFGDLRIAQLFGLPPHAIAAKSGDSLTYSTVEGQGIDFTRWSVRPWTVRIENSLNTDPDLFPQTPRMYPKFNLDAFLRADIKTRYEAHRVGIDAGFLTIAEARAYEELDPLPDPPQEDPSNVDA